ncbi:MAG: chemotaxis protein CheA [Spirochaetia bacterium]
MENFKETFLEEANDLLEQLEVRLLELENNPEDREIVAAIFRIVHTIKGASAMFGFEAVSHFTHDLENSMEYVRDGRVQVIPEMITMTLQARDHILMLLTVDVPTGEQQAAGDEILKNFKAYVTGGEGGSAGQETEQALQITDDVVEVDEADDAPKSYQIEFRPGEDVLLNGTNPILLVDEMVSLGTAHVHVNITHLPSLQDFEVQKSYLAWTVELTTENTLTDIEDVFIFLGPDSLVKIERVGQNPPKESVSASSSAAAPSMTIGMEEEDAPVAAPTSVAVSAPGVEPVAIKAPVAPPTAKAAEPPKKGVAVGSGMSQTLRISSDKLDTMVDLVGELVTFNAHLRQLGQELHSSNLTGLTEQSERLILKMRDVTMGMRMLPIGSTFSRFQRLVRDTAGSLGKDIDLVTEGGETELDKTVLERLTDPLMHIIRNSLDHGVEGPADRQAKGKSQKGTVLLAASHSGAFVYITIADDGKGIDRNRVIEKAVSKELLTPADAAELSDQEVFALIFAPGLSTAAAVTDISGRGVGMDVVRREIVALGGTITIDSTVDVGTRMVLKIPLTLAIIEGLMTRLGDNNYIFPLSAVEECLMYKLHNPEDETGFFNWRGDLVPYVNLRKYFRVEGNRPEKEQMIVISDRDGYIGFVVDRVIGNLQTLIKSLGKLYRNAQGVSGATILGNGGVALILDVLKLSELFDRRNDHLISTNEDVDV